MINEKEFNKIVVQNLRNLNFNQIPMPNKKAPQNAKYSVLRGCVLPAAGVEPAHHIGIYVRIV